MTLTLIRTVVHYIVPGTRTDSSFHWFVENSKQSHTYIEHLSLVVFDDEELTDRATTKL